MMTTEVWETPDRLGNYMEDLTCLVSTLTGYLRSKWLDNLQISLQKLVLERRKLRQGT